MSVDPIWRTWKPYAALVAAAAAAVWWYSSQSSLATLKDGAYHCKAVFVNEAGKYEVLVAKNGNSLPPISASVRGGVVVDMAGRTALPADQLASLTTRNQGSSHFHVTDDPAMHSYHAIACDHAGG